MAINDALTDEKKKFLINHMLMFLKGNSHSLLRQCLQKFADQANLKKKVRIINMRLLSTVTGGLFDSFEKWKTIPNDRDDKSKASVFEVTRIYH